MTATLRHERIAQYRNAIERERPNLRSEHATERFIAGPPHRVLRGADARAGAGVSVGEKGDSVSTWLPILNGRAQAFRFVAGQPTPPIARVHWKEEPAMNYTASGGIIEDGFQKTTIEPGDVLIRLPSGRVVVWPGADIGALLDGMELEDVTECITRRAM